MNKRNLCLFLLLAQHLSLFSEDAKQHELFLEKLIWQYSGDNGHGTSRGAKGTLMYAETNQIPKEVRNRLIMERMEKAFTMIKESRAQGDKENVKVGQFHLGKMLNLIAETRDDAWIPVLERLYAETDDKLAKFNFMQAQIAIRPIDAIERVETGMERGDFPSNTHRYVWIKIGEQYPRVNDKDKRKINAFLLRQMERTTYVNDIEDIDKALTIHVPEYRTSKQRKKYVEKFLKSGNDYTVNLGRKISEEIDKVPPAKRADLSELLRKPADETKTE